MILFTEEEDIVRLLNSDIKKEESEKSEQE